MMISDGRYFELALPGFLLFAAGLFIIPTKLFYVQYNETNKMIIANESYLFTGTLICIFVSFIHKSIPCSVSFIFYLIGILQYVLSLALFKINKRKYWLLLVFVTVSTLLISFLNGMYHDALMWLSFMALFLAYTEKPPLRLKLFVFVMGITLVLFIQSIKHEYRLVAFSDGNGASLNTVLTVGESKSDFNAITSQDNSLGTLNRTNQAWIFASTVNHMDRTKEFQGFSLVGLYLKAALLPRFLLQNKLKSGDNDIFNKFSGHYLSGGTAMGLGIFADGYISFGNYGVYMFSFFMGLLFSLTFKFVEKWMKISPLYMLLILPILNYAVRPDCETQTILNHIIKSLFLYGILVKLTTKRFTFN